MLFMSKKNQKSTSGQAKSFFENFKAIKWDSPKEVFILFGKVLICTAILTGLLIGIDKLIMLGLEAL